MKIKRNSNIELLRIISIFMVILQHYTIHNGISNSTLSFGINRLLLELISLGNIGVIIFVTITGFFCINQEKPFKLKKLFSLYAQVVFYSIVIYLVFVIIKSEQFSILELIKCMLPIAFKKYWFISAYIVLYIFTPFLNKLINSLNRKEHFLFIMVGLLIFSILHMITGQDYYGNELIQLILYYIIGAYLGKYKNNVLNDKNKNLNILLTSFFIMVLSVILFDLIGTKYSIFAVHSTYLMNRTSLISIIFSIAFLSLFNNRKQWSNNYINTISSCVLGVYLISDNPFMRRVLWTNIFKVYKYVDSNFLLLHMIGCSIVTFLTCILIDFIRKNTIGKLLDFIYDKIEDKVKKTKIYKKFIMNYTS